MIKQLSENVAGGSLVKIIYRSKRDFCNGEPLHEEVRRSGTPIFDDSHLCAK